MGTISLPDELRHQVVRPLGDVCTECGHELQLNPGTTRAVDGLARHWNEQHLFVKIRVLTALLRWLDEAEGRERTLRIRALAGFRGEDVINTKSYLGGVRFALRQWKRDGCLEEAMDEDPCPLQCLRARPHLIDGPHPFRVCTECYAEELDSRGNHPNGGGRL